MPELDSNQWADQIAADLSSIRRLLRQSFDAELAQTRLTAPQVSLLTLLSRVDGQDLGSLSRRLHLSHSTVSGIVDRLARKGLVERRVDVNDHRISRIFLTETVATYTQQTVPARQRGPLLRGAARSTPNERAAIRRGLMLLRRLLENETGLGQTLDGDQP
ncbi:MAG TPA: MarR family transcriptional regulator [Chloroflexota bacterium]